MTLVEVRFWIDGSATMVFLVKDPEDMEEIEARVAQGLKERGFVGQGSATGISSSYPRSHGRRVVP